MKRLQLKHLVRPKQLTKQHGNKHSRMLRRTVLLARLKRMQSLRLKLFKRKLMLLSRKKKFKRKRKQPARW